MDCAEYILGCYGASHLNALTFALPLLLLALFVLFLSADLAFPALPELCISRGATSLADGLS